MARAPAQHSQCLRLPVCRVTKPSGAPGPLAVACAQKGSQDSFPRSSGYLETSFFCSAALGCACSSHLCGFSTSRREVNKNLQNIFWESLQVILSPLPAGPGCLIVPNCSMLSSSLSPKYTKTPRPLLQRRELSWILHNPPPKYDQFGISSVFSKPY